jgi:MFS family permease
MLPAILFGVIVVLVPLQLDESGFTPLAIGAVFLLAGLLETVVNPFLGRFSDRRGRLLPIRVALAASVAVAIAFAVARDPYAISFLAVLAAISFGAFYTPGMALVSDRAEFVGLSQAIGFGIMNTAWALGNMTGPALAGTIADAAGDGLPYVLAAVLCALTLAATSRLGSRAGTARAPT